MDDILTLILLSLAMLVGCYLSGMLPLTITFSEEKLKLVTVLGAGLLVGTALAVIIPEGVHAMYESGGAEPHTHHIQKDAVNAPVADSAAHSKQGQAAVVVAAAKPAAEEEHQHGHNMGEEHTRIGICLVIGFIFMLLVDQIGGGHAHSPSGDAESGGSSLAHNRNKITATLGLVVHAAADGVALGAAITLAKNDITMIVFLAIMLHKAPAAFGLASFLLHQKFDIPRIRKHLLMFALAAPIMAIITYCGLSQQNKEQLSDSHTTGYAMLFSAGTFLYVATVHVLPEITTSHVTEPLPDGKLIVREHKGLRKQDLAALVIGSIVPLFLSIGHKH